MTTTRHWLPVLALALLGASGGTHGDEMARLSAGAAPPPLSIGLALGSGGATGLAHIAMLQVFDDLGVRPARITGTSIGAIIGALYAAGLDASEIRDVFDEFGGSSLDMLSGLLEADPGDKLTGLLEIELGNGGVLDSKRFMDFLRSKIEARRFSDLRIPLEVVATDYWSGKTVVLREGDLFEALAASSAVPGLFPPVGRGDQLLIDGGTSNPLPADLLAGRHPLVVAIDVSGTRERSEDGQAGLTELLFQTFGLMQQSLIASQLEMSPPDVYIKPDISGVRLLHFNRIEEVMEESEPAADALRKALEAALERQSP